MFNRFVDLRDDILKVADMDGATVTVERSERFNQRVKNFAQMLSEIDVITKELQKHGLSLAICRYAVDVLRDAVTEGRNDVNYVFYGCKLASKYIAPTSAIVHNASFESGVSKIQTGDIGSMNEEERRACEILEIEQDETFESVQNSSLTMAQKLVSGKRRCIERDTKYRNCNFVVGSVAIVERLWSVANYIYCDNRKSMTPMLLEALIFLKTNDELWDVGLVSEAMRSDPSDRTSMRIADDVAQD